MPGMKKGQMLQGVRDLKKTGLEAALNCKKEMRKIIRTTCALIHG
jgi:hypothetical protein